MKRTTATLRYHAGHGDKHDVAAWATDTPGLLAMKSPSGNWLVVHEQSGSWLYSRRTRKEAVEVAHALNEVTDWTQSVDELRPHIEDLSLPEQCKAVLQAKALVI